MLKLTLNQDGESRTFALPHDLITIGRSAQNTITLPDRKVSRKHAKIERVGASYQITDLESGNGTKVNGEKVDFHALAKGDEIKIGDALLTIGGIDDEEPTKLDDNDLKLAGDETPVPGELDAPTEVVRNPEPEPPRKAPVPLPQKLEVKRKIAQVRGLTARPQSK
jgi:predicted component of type VI protein secretion system